MMTRRCLLPLAFLCPLAMPAFAHGASVVAFWGFADSYDFTENPNKQDFAADVDATLAGDASLQAYLGNADELDDNGGGFVPYTSATSGVTYDPTRTLKYDDLRGGGDDFDLGGSRRFRSTSWTARDRCRTTSATTP